MVLQFFILATTAQFGERSGAVPAEVERLFQGSLLLLIITGFVTLASTGKLDFISVVFTSTALLCRVYLFVAGKQVRIEDRWTSYLGIAYILIYLADFFFISANFVTATVHLVLFGMIVKLFSVQRERDHVYLAVLAFLEVLSAAVLTVDTVFLVAFGVFTLTALVTFITMEMRRSALAATNLAAASSRTPRRWDRFELAVSKTCLAISLGIAVFGTGIFFLLPRLSYGYLSKLTQQNTLVSGFSDNVTLGQIGRIQQSSEVALHIKLDGDSSGGYQFKLRGTTLVNFDGKRWTNPPHTIELLQLAATEGFDFARGPRRTAAPLLQTAKSSRRHLIRYRVMMEPLGTNVVFLISRPEGLTGRFRELAVDADNTVQNLDNGRTAAEYGGYSDISEPTPQELRDRAGTLPAEIPERYLQVPRLDPRIAHLAHQVADPEPTPYLKAAALERYLSSRYAYTLELGSEAAPDPLANFLFERRRGHCEYFASSLAIMLRQLGTPTRIVTGFRGGEYNSVSGSYIIRASDAHSWVEAYIPGAGWTAFDPTPSSGPIVITGWRRAELYIDAMREFWREWIINYDVRHQETLAVSALAKSRNSLDDLRRWSSARYDRLMRWARHTNAALERDPQKAGKQAILLTAALLFVLNLRRLITLLRRLRIARNPRTAPQPAASIWYERMLRRASRRGYRRTPAQTPMEFATSISDPVLRVHVQVFTDAYQLARYANSPEAAELLPALYDDISS